MIEAARALLGHRELRVLLLVAVVVRLVVLPLAGPTTMPDTASYLLLADRIAALDLSGDDGVRTPVYPLFLLVLGRSPAAVVVAQGALGVLSTALLYGLGHAATGSRRTAAGMAAVASLDPGGLLFEAAVLTEALASFLVVAAVTAASRAARTGSAGALIAAGACASVAGLHRPALQLLPLLLVGAVVALRRGQGTPRLGVAGALVPFAGLVLGWSAFNHARFGWFTLTTLLGLNLSQHAAGFAELARPEDHALADLLVAGRAERGTPIGAIWKALPDLLEQTGLTLPALSRRLVEVCTHLFVDHPLRYGASVVKAAALFWLPAPYHAGFSWGALARLQEPAWVYAYAAAYLVVVAAFLLGVVAALVRPTVRARLASPEAVLVLVTVLSTWATTSATELGENARYKAPVQALVLAGGLLVAIRLRPSRSRASSPA